MRSLKDVAFLLIPVVLAPPILLFTRVYGNLYGDFVVGVIFFAAAYFSSKETRKLMITLAVISGMFETANVAVGSYAYNGTSGSPLWVSLGWGALGWWLVNSSILKNLEFKAAFPLSVLVIFSTAVLTNTLSPFLIISIAGLYVISLASSQKYGMFLGTAFLGCFIEYFGTFFGAWSYLNSAGSVVLPSFASLAMSYSAVYAFCFWVSGYEK